MQEALTDLSPQEQEAVRALAAYARQKGISPESLVKSGPPKIVPWLEKNLYIPETRKPIKLFPHQKAILEFALEHPTYHFQTIVYSSIKKSGKSMIGAGIGRYKAENSGHRAEVIAAANDKEQARSRSYQAIVSSIELDPRYSDAAKGIPGYWKIIEKHAVHIPTKSVIKAIANDNKGEAGANPSCVLFTEIWGLTSESAKKLWAELTPPPTRPDAIRVVETYAGYEDESTILLELFEEGMKGRRLTHDDIDWPFPDQPPIWINLNAKIFMYWDSGREARRMPWQQDDSYYRAQAATLPQHEYTRLHENRWVSSKHDFIRPEWWEACKVEGINQGWLLS